MARRFTRVVSPFALGAALFFAAACSGEVPSAPDTEGGPPRGAPESAPPKASLGGVSVRIEGAPAGITPRVTIRAGAISRTVVSSRNIDSLPAGEYTVVADEFVVNDTTWHAVPDTQRVLVQANQSANNIFIRFRPRTASLNVSAVGLPSYARGTIRISGPARFDRVALTGDTLVDLSPGTYIVEAEAVETTDGRFEPQPLTQTFSVVSTEFVKLSFSYSSPQTALSVSTSGLPSGTLAGVQVTGPSGFSERVDNARTFTGLVPGLYRAVAGRVAASGFSYDPLIGAQDVMIAAGQQRSMAVSYRLATGALAVTVGGLPSGVAGAISVTGPGGFARTVTSTQTLIDLAPGTYRLNAANVASAGLIYAASPSVLDVVVTASLVAAPAPFQYTAGAGAVSVTVAGLPPLLSANVRLTRNGALVALLTGSSLVAALPPGQYTLDALTVAGPNDSWDAQIPSRVLTVTAGDTVAAAVQYTPRTGALAISVIGLPAGVNAAIRVTGPAGADHAVFASTLLSGLAPGSYTITASPVTAGGTHYTASPVTSTVTVVRGETATSSVAYGGTSAAIILDVVGLPGGTAAATVVTGPNSYLAAVSGDTVLENLTPGNYRVTSSAVNTVSATYLSTPSVIDLVVTASSRLSRTVTYSLATGSIAVSVSGLPAGTPAAITVSGSGGFVASVTATKTLSKLAPGTYTVSAGSVVSGNTTFTASPASREVVVTASLVASAAPVTYASTTGGIRVTINGLPTPTTGAVTLSGPGGVVMQLSQTSVVGSLAAGSWTIVANPVVAAGDRYTALPATQSLTVTGNDTVSATVGFTRQTGRLAITVSGLPNGLNGNVLITGPSSYSQSLTGSMQLVGLEPGTYQISANTVVGGSSSYAPSPPSQSVVVVAGGELSRSINYSAQGTSLSIAVTGLPTGVLGAVNVTGPGGFAAVVTSSVTLSGLAAGSYTLTASPLSAGGYGYVGSPASQSVTLVTGVSKSATVAYVASSGALDLALVGLPVGARAIVSVASGEGTGLLVSGSTLLTELSPGVYSIQAMNTTAGGVSFTAAPATQSVTVSAGATASATVTYTSAATSLTVNVAGLPSGFSGSVTVSGPGGYLNNFGASTTLVGIAPGSYTIAATAVAAGGFSYAPTPATSTITLSAGQSQTHAVLYAATNGRLNINITGLPSGTIAPVTVTGPAGYSQSVSATTALSGLVPGSYTISSGTVSNGATLFTPTPATQAVTVVAGGEASAAVSFAGTGTSLVVPISGLPSGTAASVAVTGPGGYSQVLTATSTLTGLNAGTYTIIPAVVSSGGFNYAGAPTSQTRIVTTGSQHSAPVAYAVSTGRLTVSVLGLPSGVSGAVTVTGPGGYSQTVASSTTLQSLVPGSYTLAAANVSHGGSLYTAAPPSQVVSVVAGNTPIGTVSYSGQTTSLAITVSGVPSGAAGALLVTGPSGYSQAVSATVTLADLNAGTYTISASSIGAGGFSYAPSPATQTKTVTTGQQSTASVAYTASTGQLLVQLSGLPTGLSGAVSVSGPGGFAQSVSTTTTLSSLTPGSYTLTAGTLTQGGFTYTPAVATQIAAVSAGNTTVSSITYSQSGGGGNDVNMTVDGAYVTQAIQNFAGTVPLVVGRDAMLRVFVRAASSNNAQPPVRVRLYDGGSLFRTFNINAPAASVPTTVTEAALGSSWNASLSASDMRAGLRIQVDVDPDDTLKEPDEADNVWPRSGTQGLDVRTVSPFNVVFVPVRQSVNGLVGNVNSGNLESNFVSLTRMIFPLAQVNASLRAVYTTNAGELMAGDENFAWLAVLSEINSLRIADGSSAHYYGVVNTSYGGGVAGYGYVPGKASIGWDKSGTAVRVAAHELGHNFSRRHVAACGSGNTDLNYPYAGGQIGNYGWNSSSNTVVDKSSFTDIMGYCSNQWVSDYTWTNVMNYRSAAGASGYSTITSTTSSRSLMVWGRVQNGAVTLEPAFQLSNGRAELPSRGGSYRVELRDKNGTALAGFSFEPDEIDHNENAQAFSFAVPMTPQVEARLVSVAIVGGSTGVVERTPRVATTVIGSPDTPPAMIPADDGVSSVSDPTATAARVGATARLSWDDRTYPVAMVRDAQSGQVLAFLRRSGATYLPRSGQVHVSFSNGVQSVTQSLTPQ